MKARKSILSKQRHFEVWGVPDMKFLSFFIMSKTGKCWLSDNVQMQ